VATCYTTQHINSKIETLSSTDTGISSFDIANNTIVYSKTQVSNPSELYFAEANFKMRKKLAPLMIGLLLKIILSRKKTFQNELGMTVEYWIMKPSNYKQGEKYPLLLEIHGGPSAMWGPVKKVCARIPIFL
jgi:dipeptidyl aminopeptidase/acylaminoacyl peptidase